MLCPCGTNRSYEECCKIFHQGQLPETAELLMRSRYTAYALHLPEYIIKTTHPKNPQYQSDQRKWTQEILQFCHNTQFQKLEILESKEQGSVVTVSFTAHLMQNGKEVTLKEKSFFEKVKGRWLYRKGEYDT